jgi:hypothetical protein
MKQDDLKTARTRSIWALAAVAAAGASFLMSDTLEAAGAAAQPSICSRACWNARAPKSIPTEMGGLNRAVIHHTAASTDYNTTSQSWSASRVRAHQNYHMDSNGWIDIGYHFLVDKLGNTFAGRYNAIVVSKRPRGAHDGVNTNSFGFNVMGFYHPSPNQSFTTASRNAMWDVIAWRMPNGWSPYGSSSYGGRTVGYVAGHRNVKSTACPGDNVYATIGTNYSGGEARNAINARINPAPTIVTRDNSHSGFSASSNWGTATWASDKYGADYRHRNTAAVSDAATWSASLPSSGSWRVDAWWCAAANRATAAPYIVHHNNGSTVVNRNQTTNGGKWNSLGTFSINSGTRQVQLSCWTTSGEVVIADAVRWVKQ